MPSHRTRDSKYLQGHWPFNNHARDVSGHGRDGTWAGTEDYADGKFGRKVADGNNGEVSATIAGTFTEMTVTLWAKPLTVSSNNAAYETGTFTTGGTAIFRISSTRWNLYCNNGTPIYQGIVGVTANEWYHLASVFTGGTGYLYRNGLLLGSGSYTGSLVATPLVVPRTNNRDFHIGDARLYNIALSGAEVFDIFKWRM